MKLIIKNLKQVEHNVEVSSDDITVKQLKNEIEKVHGFDSNQLKLLYKGIVLDDSKTLKEYDIKEESALIMMNTKVKPKNIPQEPQNNPEQKQPENKQTTENKPVENKPIENKPTENKPNEPNYTEQINNLLNMGCEKSKAEAAIKAAKGNLELAIDFYFNGIPENNDNMLDIEGFEGAEEGENEGDPIKNVAGIAKIFCQNNPAALTTLLESIKQQNPDLFNLIKENEEDFKRYLESPVTDDDLIAFRNFQQEMGLGNVGDVEEEEGQQQHPHGGVEISLTREEEEAVKRLKELGNFNESDVLQAYFACEKNEEMAANYLFEQKMRDDDEMFGPHSHNNQNNNNNQGGQ